MADFCLEVSYSGEPCAEPPDHPGGHMTAPDEYGMATGWGQQVPADAVAVPCPALCGMSICTTPNQITGIAHCADGSHSITDAQGVAMTMHIVVAPPRLRAV